VEDHEQRHQLRADFYQQNKLAIGAVEIAPSNPNIVWVGTGDAFVSRSSYRGDGIYKSTDAGRTWKNMGLPDSHHIARIVIHPGNPDIVYVAVVGHLYSENEERGVFRTTNGGWPRTVRQGGCPCAPSTASCCNITNSFFRN
jgi:hypothetical protein